MSKHACWPLAVRAAMAGLALSQVAVAVAAQPGPIEEIIVHGERGDIASARAEAARVAGAVTVVDLGAARSRQITNLGDALRYVPGVWTPSGAGADGVYITSRGSNLDATDFDQNGVKFLQDGLPVTTADGNNHNRIIDPLASDHAVVARGANGMAWGSSTLGGAIDFRSPTGRSHPGIDVRLNGGSDGFGALQASAGAAWDNGADARVTIEGRTRDGYRDHNQQERRGIYANAGWAIGEDVTTRFYATWVDNEQQLPGSLSQAQLDADDDAASPQALGGNFQLDVETWRIANRTSWQIDATRALEFGVSWEEQALFHPIVDRILVDFDGPGPAPPVEVFSLLIDTDHRDFGAMVRYRQAVGDHELVAGVNFGDGEVDGRHFRNLGGQRNGVTNLIDNDAQGWELFVRDNWRLTDALTLVVAAQGSFADRSARTTPAAGGIADAPEGDFSSFNPSLGLIAQVTPAATLYGNVSRLYEAPTHFQLEDDVTSGDEPLDAMHGTVVEVGGRGESQFDGGHRAFWDIAAYYAWMRDEILSVEDPLRPGTSLADNADRTVHAGIEALVGADLQFGEQRLETLLSVTINQFEFDGDARFGDNDLPSAPSYVLRGEAIWRHPGGLFAGPTFDLVGARDADFANQYRIDAYGLLGLRGGYEARTWRVFVELQNLLDEHYIATHGVRETAAPNAQILSPGAPRSVFAGVAVSL